MKKRIVPLIAGGVVALILSAALYWPVYSGSLDGKPNRVSAQDSCDCSKCRDDQKCCPTANGQCGCFPGSIQC